MVGEINVQYDRKYFIEILVFLQNHHLHFPGLKHFKTFLIFFLIFSFC